MFCFECAVIAMLLPALVVNIVVVVAFSSLARIWGECSTIHFLPALLCLFLEWRLDRAH